MGVLRAEEMICQVLVDLATCLANLSPRRSGLDADYILAEARAVIPLAEKVGMLGLARVAESVVECAGRREAAALAATLARLQRVGDRSLLDIWDFTDLA
ncbi:hypothetical protein IV417_08365 [Alphaproteobacteria bacterium KMM 3653]|uniref:Uncharacterized protein n=1 Tax=Harenicola maris TaxID=2841044 RepID=A0AAP2CN00_9RHOB|nr:hypothetical protein [Harenicola maris]